MTQFDPNMVAQMLMQPVGRESLSRSISDENYFEPIEIPSPDRVAPLDMQGGFFIDPETAGKVAYGGAVTGASFLPGAGVVDAAGGAVDVFGQPLPSFGENIRQGNYFDAALQGLGVAGDVATVAAPLTLGASAVLGAMLKAPGAARKIGKATDVASDIGSIAKVEPPTETKPGIIAFHGSGADFDEFRLEKIGTGEGAQAFGYGLYFSDSEDIAKFYKNQILKTQNVEYKGKPIKFNNPDDRDILDKELIVQGLVRDRILGGKFNSQKAIDSVIDQLEQTIENSYDLSQPFANVIDKQGYNSLVADLDYAKTLKADDFNYQEGKLYKVAIQPKADELLDYDKPLSEQPKILEKLENAFGAKELNVLSLKNAGLDSEKLSGRRLYELLKDEYGGDKLASEELSKSGINGIKFLTGDARNTFGGELLSVDKTADGQFRAKVVLDDPNRQTGLGGSGRTITTSKPYKTEKEARDWADKSIGRESNNYVIFDDKLVKIMEKYGIVGPVAVSATAAALKDDDRSL